MATTRATTRKTTNTASAKAGAQGRVGVASVDAKVNLAEVRKEARKPLYAYVGAGDFAVQKIRKLPELYTDVRTNYATAVKDLPGSLRSTLHDLSGRATELYSDFAQRGERVVTTIRRQPATQKAVDEAKTAVRQTRTAAAHATRSARAAGKAAEDAAHKAG
jgi:hypothetical protein